MLAAFPAQGHVLQRVQAQGIRAVQAQFGGARFLQVKLAQGGQHRFQPAIGQGHLLRAELGVRAVRQVDQDEFVIAAPGQAFRVEQLDVRTHQVQQNRQQAQSLTVDDDPQFQIEPVPFRRFFDRGVPFVHRRQVETEILVDLQLPALATQFRQIVEGERQPGTVVDHLVQLTGAFGQGLALPGCDFEAEDA